MTIVSDRHNLLKNIIQLSITEVFNFFKDIIVDKKTQLKIKIVHFFENCYRTWEVILLKN